MTRVVDASGQPLELSEPAPWKQKMLQELRLVGPEADLQVRRGGRGAGAWLEEGY